MDHYDGSEWEPPVLVAVLSNEDEGDWVNDEGTRGFLGLDTSRVSPNGEWRGVHVRAAVDRATTTCDAASGVPDEEVYLYQCDAWLVLVCASCDPTGARPAGVFDPSYRAGYMPAAGRRCQQLVDAATGWLAACKDGLPYRSSNALYQSRYLSNNGRLFFDSPDALVPADVERHGERV